MNRSGKLFTGFCLLASSVALAQTAQTTAGAPAPPAAQPDDRIVRAEAPIVAGNAASAKKRALADAFRQATEKVFAELLKEGPPLPEPWPPGVVQIKASLASAAQKFIRSYRLIEQQNEGGVVRVMVEIDVDTVSLRHEIDRARAPAGASASPPKPVANAILVAGPAAGPVVAALNAAGARAVLDPATGEAQLAGSAAKQNAHALFATAESSSEGGVRGTARVAVRCALHSRLLLAAPAGGRTSAVDRHDPDWGFAADEAGARNACLGHAASTATRALVAVLHAPAVAEPFVTVLLEIEDAGAVSVVLQALKRLGAVTATEPRHVSASMAELRVFTRIAGPALAQALLREVGGKLAVEPTQTTNSQVGLRVRKVDRSVLDENR